MKTSLPHRGPWLLTLVLALALTAARAATPSFDCTQPPKSSIDEMICGDDGLAELDVKMAEVYAQAQKKAKGKVNQLKAEQSGWIKGRDDCGKADDKRQCAQDAYQRRIAELQATYRLVPANGPHTWFCNNDSKDEIVVTFFPTDPPTLIATKKGRSSLMYLQPSGSGSKYVGPSESFWEHQNRALVSWGWNASDVICQKKP